MENNIKKSLDSIDVPLDKLDDAILKGIHSQQKKRKFPIKKGMLMILASGVLILCSGFISPKVATVLANVPLIGFMYSIEEHDAGLYDALSDDNKVVLNETVTSSGIPFTIEEVVYDGARLNIIFTMPEYGDVYPLTILVDGERINNSESLRELDGDGVFRGLWEIQATEPLPEAFDLTIKIHQIDHTKGDWQFTTPIQKVNNESKELAAGQKGIVDDIEFTMESVVTSTTMTMVEVRFNEDYNKLFSENRAIHPTFVDQNNNPLAVLNASGSGDENGLVYKYLLNPLADDVTNIQLIYYFIPNLNNQIEMKEPIPKHLPQRISLGEAGYLIISNIANDGIESTMTLTVESDIPFDHNFTPGFVDIRNTEGESLVTDYIHAVAPNEYKLTYQNNVGKAYIHTRQLPQIQVEETAKVMIPIQ
ncbi:DUF4179 domain-containing protein [Solibacillus sp. FSL K6-1523]|uniref:DUF4179 domain-containing protein n=1 Tax=Solibacillus sp. FSL K6-1523 TaxID=2921471 RepID=UPI0030F62B1F